MVIKSRTPSPHSSSTGSGSKKKTTFHPVSTIGGLFSGSSRASSTADSSSKKTVQDASLTTSSPASAQRGSSSKKPVQSTLRSSSPAPCPSVASSSSKNSFSYWSASTRQTTNVDHNETRQEEKTVGETVITADTDDSETRHFFGTLDDETTFVSETRQGIFNDETTCGFSIDKNLGHHQEVIDEISKKVEELQSAVVNTEEKKVRKWKLILEKQRSNVNEDIKKLLQPALAEATKAREDKIDKGTRKWERALADATAKKQEKYVQELMAWQTSFDNASTMIQIKAAKKAWRRLEASRQVPTKEMQVAEKMLKQLKECVDVDTKEMKTVKKMIKKLETERDAPTRKMALTSKKEEEFVEDVMKWQKALADATEEHEKKTVQWEVALCDARRQSKDETSRQVIDMLSRLVATREVPSDEMKKASEMLESLEGEKDSHAIMMRYAGSKVYEAEEELLKLKRELEETKNELRDAIALKALQPRYDSYESSTCVTGTTYETAEDDETAKQRGFLHELHEGFVELKNLLRGNE